MRTDEAEILMYSYDAGMARARPEVVIRFTAAAQVAPAVKILHKAAIPFVPRLAGTNLSGGTIALKGGAILNLSSLKKIHRIDTENRVAVVEPGVVNLALQNALEPFGFFYAPDPASQKVSTIGGNIGENAGGPQCLKYGVTSDNVEKLEVVTPEGEVKTWSYRDPGPDLMSFIIGSEGTLGIVTRAWLKIIEKPAYLQTSAAAFSSLDNAMLAVTKIISSGIVPRALEAMDSVSLEAAGGNSKLSLPPGTEALLIIELDGDDRTLIKRTAKRIEAICAQNSSTYFRTSGTEEERETLWAIRKGAYPAMARLAPNVSVEDGVVPRPILPQALKETREILLSYKLTAGLLFHAGDGNLHPNIIFDGRDMQEVKRVKKAGYEILKSCIRLGGTISGEHGIGVEKRVAMAWLYDTKTLDFFKSLKTAFDPAGLSNPDKILPVSVDNRQKVPVTPAELGAGAKTILDELRLRAKAGTKTLILGLGTKINASVPGARTLELKNLDKILDLDRENLTVKAEAGIKISELKRQLGEQGFTLAIPDLKGSLGGSIAAKTFPEMRSLLLGLDLAMADGTALFLGGKTLKNVAGYDAVKLFCGSLGAYGIILSATLKISVADDARGRGDHSAASPFPTSINGGLEPAWKELTQTFEPLDHHRRLKKALDPANLLNPWIYEGQGRAYRDEGPGKEILITKL